MAHIVSIIGRPNVGKSTLFNRLVGERKAIVDDMSGVTRDRHYARSDWNGHEFIVVDTGGFVAHSNDVFEKAIKEQVLIAIEEADILLFLVDVTTGITDLDADFAQMLRKSRKLVLLVVNKVDNYERIPQASEFYKLGLGDLYELSSITGSGTGELLDEMVKRLQELPVRKEEETDFPKVAIVGRPNVGKSSMINALLGEARNIVTPIAGTTRDTIHTVYKAFGNELMLIDTAGIRKKGKVTDNIEFYSVLRSIRAIEECDVCVLMIDAEQGLESQDLNLFHLAEKNGKGLIIVINKWDLVEKGTNTSKAYEEEIRKKTAPFRDFPILFTSVPQMQRVHKLVETITEVHGNLSNRVATSKLNEYLLPIIQETPPPSVKGKYIRIKYISQLKARYITIAFFCNLPQYVREDYKRFLENKLREKFPFHGVPIRLIFKKK